MVEVFKKAILTQEPSETEIPFALFISCNDVPDTVKKSEESDLGHAILACDHLLTDLEPEWPVD